MNFRVPYFRCFGILEIEILQFIIYYKFDFVELDNFGCFLVFNFEFFDFRSLSWWKENFYYTFGIPDSVF